MDPTVDPSSPNLNPQCGFSPQMFEVVLTFCMMMTLCVSALAALATATERGFVPMGQWKIYIPYLYSVGIRSD